MIFIHIHRAKKPHGEVPDSGLRADCLFGKVKPAKLIGSSTESQCIRWLRNAVPSIHHDGTG